MFEEFTGHWKIEGIVMKTEKLKSSWRSINSKHFKKILFASNYVSEWNFSKKKCVFCYLPGT